MKKKLILIIMPKDNYLEKLKKNLEANAFEIMTANDGKTGFELARKTEPDLILSAMQLEKLDGIDLCYMIRQSTNLSTTPFILIVDTGEDLKVVSDIEMEKFNLLIDLVKMTVLTGNYD